jgi:hypothetical protein
MRSANRGAISTARCEIAASAQREGAVVMVIHVVLMQLRSDVDERELAALALRIRQLADMVAGRDSCVVGPNVTEEPLAQDYDFGFVIRFAHRVALDAYHVNPAHLPVSLIIGDLASSVLVFDFAG